MSMEDRPIFCRNCGTRLDPVSGECPKCSPRPAMPSQHLRSGYKQNFCTECGSRLDPATGRCPNPWCSQGLPAKPRPHRGKTLLICLLLLLLAGSGICLYFFYPRLLTAMENREWLQSADDMTTETWVPKESEEPHISETHPKETVTKEQPVQETYQEESEIETVSSEELEKTQILLQAKDYLNQHQYRHAIQLVDEAYLKFGDEEFRQLAGNYRMAFGKYFNTIFAAGKYNSAVLQDGYVRVVGDDEYGEKYMASILPGLIAEKALCYLFCEQNLVSEQLLTRLVFDLELDIPYLEKTLAANRRPVVFNQPYLL